tara:strand:- start:44 stop:343 length:300 start_codon:yes stop_codon:yes gene_type:complete
MVVAPMGPPQLMALESQVAGAPVNYGTNLTGGGKRRRKRTNKKRRSTKRKMRRSKGKRTRYCDCKVCECNPCNCTKRSNKKHSKKRKTLAQLRAQLKKI